MLFGTFQVQLKPLGLRLRPSPSASSEVLVEMKIQRSVVATSSRGLFSHHASMPRGPSRSSWTTSHTTRRPSPTALRRWPTPLPTRPTGGWRRRSMARSSMCRSASVGCGVSRWHSARCVVLSGSSSGRRHKESSHSLSNAPEPSSFSTQHSRHGSNDEQIHIYEPYLIPHV